MGLEFLDVTDRVSIAVSRSKRQAEDQVRITNDSASVVDTHLLIVVQGLPGRARLANASGLTSDGNPFVRVFLDDGVLVPGQSIVQGLRFVGGGARPSYALRLLSGQGTP
jgi:hypothetical protein